MVVSDRLLESVTHLPHLFWMIVEHMSSISENLTVTAKLTHCFAVLSVVATVNLSTISFMCE